MNKTSVYRNGSLTPATYTGEVLEHTEKADAMRPEGHAPRHGSLFASPSLEGVGRWASARISNPHIEDIETRELTINPEGIYVYSVKAWEAYSWRSGEVNAYWDSAIPLSEWESAAMERNLDPTEWEILIPADRVLNARRVTAKRLIAAQPEESLVRYKLMQFFKR